MIRKIFLAYLCLILLTGCLPGTPTALVERAAPTVKPTPLLPAESQTPAAAVETPTGSTSSTAVPSPADTATAPVDLSTEVPVPTEVPRPTATPLPRLASGTPLTLMYLQMIDLQTGWAIDANGRILHTADGANHWADVTPPGGSYWAGGVKNAATGSPGGFFALDAVQAWAVPYLFECYSEDCSAAPETAAVWHTTDGGQSWQPSRSFCPDWSGCDVTPGNPGVYEHALYPVALQFIDAKTGWLLVVMTHLMFQDHYGLYHTTDGGSSWDLLITSESGPMAFNLTGLAFVDAHTGWMAISEVGGAVDPSPDWSLAQTLDGGQTWNTLNLPAPSLPEVLAQDQPWCGADAIRTVSPNVVDAVFGCSRADQYSQEVYFVAYHSVDGGQTWTLTPASRSVAYLDASNGWRVLDLNASAPTLEPTYPLQRTVDGGKTWSDLRAVTWEAARFNFITPLAGWAVVRTGEETAVIQTADAGRTWHMLNPKIN